MFSNYAKTEIFSEVSEGIVDEVISTEQRGRVRCFGTYWSAQMYQNNCVSKLDPDQKVFIVGRIGLTLLVSPK